MRRERSGLRDGGLGFPGAGGGMAPLADAALPPATEAEKTLFWAEEKRIRPINSYDPIIYFFLKIMSL